MQNGQEWLAFNGFIFPVLPRFSYKTDGRAGERVLFITDEEETCLISFEQGMHCLDLQKKACGRRTVYREYRQDGRYLHQRTVFAQDGTDFQDIVFFHMELTDENGQVHTCPGQMFLSPEKTAQEGVEPLLLQLLNGMEPCREKGGGA